jgi:hypothetical protein
MTERTTHTIKEWLEAQTENYGQGDIWQVVAQWTLDAFEYESEWSVKDVIQHLETTDCAACHAPAGLIYNGDIAAKAAEWYSDIDDAIAAYHDETGDMPKPHNGAITIGFLVWFAVEWVAHDMARLIEGNTEDGTIV